MTELPKQLVYEKKLFSSELEMKRNEFYYPGELLYAELFHLPTYSETVENKSTQFNLRLKTTTTKMVT